MSSESLNSIVFIDLPEDFVLPTKDFTVDNTIPLPVQLPQNTKLKKEDLNTSSLTVEMILAGILTILAYDTQNKNINYYRSLLKAARPQIRKELTEAAIFK